MNVFDFVKQAENKARLAVLYVRRILFAPRHFPISRLKGMYANTHGGFTADQWALYDLNNRKRKEYLSEFDWYRSRYINDPFSVMLNNKLITTEVLRRYICVPQVYFINNRGTFMDFEGNVLDMDSVREKLTELGHVIVKPYDKGKGTGVHTISHVEGKLLIDDCPAGEDELEKLLRKQVNCYYSERVQQHAYADALYDKTVNTIRLITIRDPKTQKFKVFFAVQRIGREKTIPVDNGSQGGIVCRIDPETGKLSHGRCLHDKVVYERHPDSGIRLEDVTVPDWEETKREFIQLAEKLPYLHFVAWDIVKLPDGRNCVIEANTSSGVNIIQLWGGQRNGELGDFYRYHKVIR